MKFIKLLPRGRRGWMWAVIRISVILGVLGLVGLMGACYMVGMPGKSFEGELPPLSEEEAELSGRLRGHVQALAETIGERNVFKRGTLEEAAQYIDAAFSELGHEPGGQSFLVHDQTLHNIVAEQPGGARADEIVVVGGHYDTVDGCPGANDNASGVAATLEIARLLAGGAYPRTIRYVSFVNEEPPFFQTPQMGSLVYARRCRERKDNIVAMLSLETIGYYSDAPQTQQYPYPFKYFYSSTGNFIGFVGNIGSRGLVRQCIGSFRRHTKFPSEGAVLPEWVPGAGWSDQWSFWREGYPALMLTDTAPYRYPHYHSEQDTPEKIDYDRMARVVAGVSRVVAELAGKATE